MNKQATSMPNKLQRMPLGTCVYYITEDTIYNTVRNKNTALLRYS